MGVFGRLLAIVAVVCGMMAVYNVFADNPGLERLAQRRSCEADRQSSCRPRLARVRRSPFTQAFVFSVAGAEVEVDCRRAFWLFGDYKCTRQLRVELQVH